jgi:hypothetical protein
MKDMDTPIKGATKRRLEFQDPFSVTSAAYPANSEVWNIDCLDNTLITEYINVLLR